MPSMRLEQVRSAISRVYDRSLKLKGAPREIALGFSLGVMIGMTPFLGLHILASVVLASCLGWSKISALAGVNITNLFTAPLIYALNYWVGVNLTGLSKGTHWPVPFGYQALVDLIQQSPLIVVDLFIGGVVLGLPLAIAGYLVVLKAVCLYRSRMGASVADPCSR
jgi:uncharacterized protein (DUF2062 family)